MRDYYGYNVHRGKVFYGESDVVGLDGIHIECKAVERLNVREAYHQSVDESIKKGDGEPVVIHKKNRDGWLVTMGVDLFMDMYGAWKDE